MTDSSCAPLLRWRMVVLCAQIGRVLGNVYEYFDRLYEYWRVDTIVGGGGFNAEEM